MPDKCPYCGINSCADDVWVCGSVKGSSLMERTAACVAIDIAFGESARMQPVIDALSKYITDLRGDASGMDLNWITVSDAYDEYKEGDQCDPS